MLIGTDVFLKQKGQEATAAARVGSAYLRLLCLWWDKIIAFKLYRGLFSKFMDYYSIKLLIQ